MEVGFPSQSACADLERVLERQIEQRTGRRLRRLRVDVTHERVVVHGFTLSYYVKQLALQAVLESLRAVKGPPVELDIEVGNAGGRDPRA